MKKQPLEVAVVGGGLVGALNACFLAKRGHRVDLYESRDDIRLLEHVPGRSINLALSTRGRAALAAVGLETAIIQDHGIPMYARMIHNLDGTVKAIPYGKKDQCIYSVGRRHLNEVLLSAAEKYTNVKIHFNHKLVSADLANGEATFEKGMEKEIVKAEFDMVMGNDGAYSNVRKEMMKQPLFNFSQTYIQHGYRELCIPATEDDRHAMEINYLHIWPRGTFMMIALPNQDKSFTVTLFMPVEKFSSLTDKRKLLSFFKVNFPDSIPLLGEDKLVEDFFKRKPSYLVSVKCNPYHMGKVIIMGDAAHAMVPFYGQGMNAGFEDCLIFDELMKAYDSDLSIVFPAFSNFRNPDAEAICDLAMYNYIEMRDLVNSKMFLLRKKLDMSLHSVLGRRWMPLYSMVTFSRTRYHKCIEKRERQDKLLGRAGVGATVVMSAAVICAVLYLRTKYGGKVAEEVIVEAPLSAMQRVARACGYFVGRVWWW